MKKMSLQKELELFHKLVGEYLIQKRANKKLKLISLYNSLKEKVAPESSARTAIDALFRLIE